MSQTFTGLNLPFDSIPNTTPIWDFISTGLDLETRHNEPDLIDA
ncbi:MAG: hypothetical protein WA631_07095 [Nitrososphaeraceae archaeon]